MVKQTKYIIHTSRNNELKKLTSAEFHITIAVKYTLAWETLSLFRRKMFLDFLRRSPQSTTISQYVFIMVARADIAIPNTFQLKLSFSSKAVLTATATIVKKYLKPLYRCTVSFSSNNRRIHYKTRIN